MIWHLNNTSIRNPSRSKKLIEAYSQNGPILGIFKRGNTKAQQELFEVCQKSNAIRSDAVSNEDKAWWGRKIRLTLKEFGLISATDTDEYAAGEITKTGLALKNAQSDIEILDVFQRIFFNLETRKKNYQYNFRPIPLIINVLSQLGEETSSTAVSRDEFALILQNYKSNYEISNYVEDIMLLRENLKANKGKIKEFYKKKYQLLSREANVSINTVRLDYPDVTIRTLILSQIFVNKGKGIKLNPQYEKLISILRKDMSVSGNTKSYYNKIMNLPPLPFDSNRNDLFQVVFDKYEALRERELINKNNLQKPSLSMSSQELDSLRLKQDEVFFQSSESDYAYAQRHKTDIILKWFERLTNNIKNFDYDDEYIGFDNDDRPQYLEWVIWRAFLSINSLMNKPYESRKFKVGSDFKPISHAPAGSPDLLFEFEKFMLVVEVTFTSSSRQVAAEGVPVRHHVADISKLSRKPTYCLFIAPKIDINTLDDFKNKNYYIFENDDTRPEVNIIPLQLSSFIKFFQNVKKADSENPEMVFNILRNCRDNTHLGEREWEEYINNQFSVQ